MGRTDASQSAFEHLPVGAERGTGGTALLGSVQPRRYAEQLGALHSIGNSGAQLREQDPDGLICTTALSRVARDDVRIRLACGLVEGVRSVCALEPPSAHD